jgi:hypothetical protein
VTGGLQGSEEPLKVDKEGYLNFEDEEVGRVTQLKAQLHRPAQTDGASNVRVWARL